MTKEELDKIPKRLFYALISKGDMSAQDLLYVSFVFCSTMLGLVLETLSDKSKINEAKADIKDVFINGITEYVDNFNPEEE